jgi:hypothetical protein
LPAAAVFLRGLAAGLAELPDFPVVLPAVVDDLGNFVLSELWRARSSRPRGRVP